MPATATVSKTSNPLIDGVLTGGKWAVSNFTYSFPTSASYYGSGYGSGEPTNGFEAFNAAQQAAVGAVLKSYSAVANLTFTEITETSTQHADLRFAEIRQDEHRLGLLSRQPGGGRRRLVQQLQQLLRQPASRATTPT